VRSSCIWIRILPLIIVITLPLILVTGTLQAQAPTGPTLPPDLASVVTDAYRMFNLTAVLKHIEYFASLGSRFTGYPGFYKAAEYIKNVWESYGLDVWTEEFEVTIPMSKGAEIVIELPNGTRITMRAYPLMPNYVNPCPYESPPEGDILIWGGNGYFEDFTGKPVNGSFVVMDFNCRWYWENALILGAKGVIFTTPSITTRIEAEWKALAIPYNFPRLYLSKGDSITIRKLLYRYKTLRAWIKSDMEWIRVKAYNIIAAYRPPEIVEPEIAVISAYYDAFSIVPELAPGASDAIGIAMLLELPKLFLKHPPKREIWFVAFAGHYQGLKGGREFIDRHFDDIASMGKRQGKLALFISLDLVSDNQDLAMYSIGNFYSYFYPESIRVKFASMISNIFYTFIPALESIIGRNIHIFDEVAQSYPPWYSISPPYEPFIKFSEAEVFLEAAYGGGLTIITTNCLRMYRETPFDTFRNLNPENIKLQGEVLWPLLYYIVNMPITYDLRPFRYSADHGWIIAKLQLGIYNTTTRWYDNFTHPDAIVMFYQQPLTGAAGFMSAINLRAFLGFIEVIKPNPDGSLVVKGLKPMSNYVSEAYVIDRRTGRILYATDSGVFAWQSNQMKWWQPLKPEYSRFIPVFPCASIVIIGAIDPQTFQYPGLLEVWNFISHGYSVWRDSVVSWPDAMAFVPPGMPMELMIRSLTDPYPLAVLNNATFEAPEGQGIILHQGDWLLMTPIRIAEHVFILAKARADMLRNKMANSPTMELYYSRMVEYYDLLYNSIESMDWGRVYVAAVNLWAFARGTYVASRTLLRDVILTAAFFAMLLVPFVFFLERLTFKKTGMQRIIIMSILYVLAYAFMIKFHPGFTIATNVYIVFLASAVFVIALLLVVFLGGEVNYAARFARRAILGAHFVDVERSSMMAAAFSIAIENMRRRRLRSSLTLISMIMVAFALTSFSSIYSNPIPYILDVPNAKPFYTGIYIRRPITMSYMPIPEQLYLELSGLVSGIGHLLPRSWFYTPGRYYYPFWGNTKIAIIAIVGIDPHDMMISEYALINGTWFSENDLFACVIPDSMFGNLTQIFKGFTIGSQIELWGLKLVVKGVFDSRILSSLPELDGIPGGLLPINIKVPTGAEALVRVPAYYVIIVPFKLTLMFFNQPPNTVSVVFPDTTPFEELERIATAITYRTGWDTFVSKVISKEKLYGIIKEYKARFWYALKGAYSVIPPIIIGLFTLTLTMLAAVYERVRDIKVYSAVGLSPRHVAELYITEALVFSIVGSVLGYMIGTAIIYYMWHAGWYPKGFVPNVTSLAIVFILLGAMAFSLLASLYPSLKASKLVTPSLERRWRVTQRPRGREWSISLPFVITEYEVLGLLYFLKEYLETYSIERTGPFYLPKPATVTKGVTPDGRKVWRIECKMYLPPYDMGIIQFFQLSLIQRPGRDTYNVEIYLRRESGYETPWITANKVLLDGLRKQFLIWRSLGTEDKRRYIKAAKDTFTELRL